MRTRQVASIERERIEALGVVERLLEKAMARLAALREDMGVVERAPPPKQATLAIKNTYLRGADDGRSVIPERWLKSEAFLATLDEWIKYRAEIKKPLTLRMLKANMVNVRDCSAGEVTKAMREGMASSWVGLHPPRRRDSAPAADAGPVADNIPTIRRR